jgi:hypothetical protein
MSLPGLTEQSSTTVLVTGPPVSRSRLEHFSDVFCDHTWIGRAQGTLETRRLEPRQIRAGALRFDPDELVLDKGKLVIVDVRIEPAPAKPEDGAIDAPVAAARGAGRRG